MSIDRAGIASDAFAVTPHDTNAQRAAGLYVGGAGNVAVTTEDGTTVTFSGVTAGSVLPIKVLRVLSTNTTATLILGLK